MSADRPVENLEIGVRPGRVLAVKVHKSGSDEPVAQARVRVHEKRDDNAGMFPQPAADEDDDEGDGGAPVAMPPMRARAARAVSVSSGGGRSSGFTMRPGNGGGGDEDNKPPAYDKTLETDSQGIAKFVGLPDTTVEVTAKKLDLAPSEPIEIEVFPPTAGAPAPEVSLGLSEGGGLEGRVLRGGETPAIGASVELTGPDPNNAKKTATVDGQGRYRYEHLRPGVYHAEVKTSSDPFGGMRIVMTNGDQPAGVAAHVQDAKITTLDLEAPILATVTGTVTQAGIPIVGARVSLTSLRDGGFDMPMGGFDFGGSKSATTNSKANTRSRTSSSGKLGFARSATGRRSPLRSRPRSPPPKSAWIFSSRAA